ncbi:hypothetical protein AAC387_Pa07g0026 [Persea americana]
MDCLNDTANDVQILCQNGIIDRWLGSNEDVADLFTKIGKEVTGEQRKKSKETRQTIRTKWNGCHISNLLIQVSRKPRVLSETALLVRNLEIFLTPRQVAKPVPPMQTLKHLYTMARPRGKAQ